ncbi:MAG: hypothetical protein A3D28_00245 [Omnitrophica bacterium RIFCSPHIGHO2_02_FULL_63_14]|nr:MAG: hypothetical protein A3D28_00245 [Omnitrophica bacterium RIFCSPHIGHO2_02_FULL_63_14]
MEHLVRHHSGLTRPLFLALALFLLMPSSRAAVSSEKPGEVSSPLDFADGLYARGMYKPAASEYLKFIETHPASPELASACFRLADSHYFLKEYPQALGAFEAFTRDFPSDKRVPIARFRVATARFNLGQYREAQRLFFRLARESGDETVRTGSLFYFGKIHGELGRPGRMKRILGRIVRNHPDAEYAVYSAFALGEQHLKEKNAAEALPLFRKVADAGKPAELSLEARYRLAGIHFEGKDFAAAERGYGAVYVALKPKPEPAEHERELLKNSLLGLFSVDGARNDAAAASRRLLDESDVIDRTGIRDKALYLIADIHFDKKEYDRAAARLDEILAGPGDDAVKEQARARAKLEQARRLTEAGKLAEALALLEAVSAPGEGEPARQAAFEAGGVKLEMGRQDDAVRHYEAFIAKYPGSYDAERAKLQIMQIDLDARRFDKALKEADAFLVERPPGVFADVARYKKGLAEMGLKDHAGAAVSFQKIADDPGSELVPEALYAAGVSFEKLPDPLEAARRYETFVKTYPAHTLHQNALQRLGVLYLQTEQFDKAAELYEDVFFNRRGISLESRVVVWLIQHRLQKGEVHRAEALIAKLAERFPGEKLEHERFYFDAERARIEGRHSEALALYDQALAAAPNGPFIAHVWLGKGMAAAASGRPAEAEGHFQEALKIQGPAEVNLRARFEAAKLRVAEEKWEEAAKAFMLVAILFEDDRIVPQALHEAVQAFGKAGQTENAAKAAQELNTRYPDSEWAKK